MAKRKPTTNRLRRARAKQRPAAIPTRAEAEDKPATLEQWAAVEFEPDTKTQEPPDNKEWIKAVNPHLIAARIAWFTCQKTKAELVEMLREDEDGTVNEMLKSVTAANGYFAYFFHLTERAQTRLLVAGSVLEQEADKGRSRAPA